VFLNALPESTRVVVGVIEAAGDVPEYAFGSVPPVHSRASIDVLVRSTVGPAGFSVPTNARVKIQRVWNRLSEVTNASLSGSTYLRIEPDSEPYLIERDDKGRVVFGCSFTVLRRGTTSV
jgi:hypothetical protein